MNRIAALIAGLLFGAGVTLSGMVNPLEVLNFMDIAGTWDPTLIFVMGAGLIVTFIGYRLVFNKPHPLYEPVFSLPSTTRVDLNLIGGAILFGAGWGLTGFCPGPAVASLVLGYWQSFLFVAAMAAGIMAVKLVTHRPAATREVEG